MTDKELLELAAKAAGIEIRGWTNNVPYVPSRGTNKRSSRFWKPLTDDGDALRLAVKLSITPMIFETGGYTEALYGLFGCTREFHNDEPYAATRRAIVRAAASIANAEET